MKNVFLMLAMLLFLSCENNGIPPDPPSTIYDNYKASVAIVEHSYYYKVEIQDGSDYYFNIINDEVVFYKNEEDAKSESVTMIGTGFFISEKGELVTNRHVVTAEIDEIKVVNELKEMLDYLIENRQDKIELVKSYYNENYTKLNTQMKDSVELEYKSTNIQFEKFTKDAEILDNENYRILFNSHSIKIILNDTRIDDAVTSLNAKIVKISEDPDVDLAIIQLEDENLPKSVKKYISIEDPLNFNVSPKINDEVFMIGYNAGLVIARTQNGIKSQFTQGQISQDPDSKRILYSIPALQGSSGSPVINGMGKLMAVNFAGFIKGQGFNFGVPAQEMWKLYYDDEIPVINNTNSNTSAGSVNISENIKAYFANTVRK